MANNGSKGISVNAEKCASFLEESLSLVTALVPKIGYDKAAAIAKEAHQTGKSIREIAKQINVLPGQEIDDILDRMLVGK